MAIYRFRAEHGIPVPPEGPDTTTEVFRLLAAHNIAAMLLDQEVEPLDLTPPNSDNLRYTLTVTDVSSAHLDIEPVGDNANAPGKASDSARQSIDIPSKEPLVSIIDENPPGEFKLYDVIAILPSDIKYNPID